MTLIGKYKIFLVLSIVLAAVSVMLQLYVPILFGDAIDQIIPEIYNQAMFAGTALLYQFPAYIYSLWKEYSEEELGEIAEFCQDAFSICLFPIWISTAPEILSAGSQPTLIFCPMVSCLVLPSCFPES